jgi:hypothetical protein
LDLELVRAEENEATMPGKAEHNESVKEVKAYGDQVRVSAGIK